MEGTDGAVALPRANRELPGWSRPALKFIGVLFESKIAFGAAIVLLVAAIYGVAGESLVKFDPEVTSSARLEGPSLEHPLGTDNLGRDLYSRASASAHVSMTVAALSTLFALCVGVPIGLVSGYAGGLADLFLMRIVDAIYAVPSIILALAMLVILGNGIVNISAAIALIYVPIFARIVRSQTLLVGKLDYVTAARSQGASPLRIVGQHVWPNVRSPVIVQASLVLGFSILIEAALSYLGFGVDPATPTWGRMTRAGYSYLSRSPWVALVPGFIIFSVVLSCNLVGDALRDALDPRTRAGKH